jgi:hypothetical protein
VTPAIKKIRVVINGAEGIGR